MADRVGFIGLGIMGGGMARNLLGAGMEVTVYNRTRAKTAAFATAGAAVADSPRDLAARCDIVITCVSGTADVEEVISGEQGVLSGLSPEMLVIDMSTISPEATRRLAFEVEEAGGHYLDAPISGGSEGAQRGTLSIMVGGRQEDVRRAQPLFDAMGSRTTHVGPVGSGQSVKLVNQVLVVVNMLGIAEALVFAQASGLDLERALQAVTGGAAGSWMLENRGPQCITGDWRPGFAIDLQVKDLRLALEAARAAGVPLATTQRTLELYETLQARGLGGEGNHALVKALEHHGGVTRSESDG